jgi:metal-responsive CopG/Arc/MetJ family transcriptional regulator
MRTHVVIPKQLVDSIDELVGTRNRSRFFTEAVEEKLSRVRLVRAARKLRGWLAGMDIPGWESSESAAKWVRSSRQQDDETLAQTWRER